MRVVPAMAVVVLIAMSTMNAEGQPVGWNVSARQFIFAPTLDFQPLERAGSYRIQITTVSGKSTSFDAPMPAVSLSLVWDDLSVGDISVKIEALDEAGKPIAVADERHFHRGAVFHPISEKPAISYAQSAQLALDDVLARPFVRSWLTAKKPDSQYGLYRYASKIIGSLMTACAIADSAEALQIGKNAADFLISVTTSQGPLAGLPPTYYNAKPTARENDHWTMMMTPAEAGQGYLDLYAATHEEKYLNAALAIADAYRRLQLPSGTWHLKVDNRTNEPMGQSDLIPAEVIDFLSRMNHYGHAEFAQPVDRAVNWMMQNPVSTWNWQAQFDDAKLRGPYENLAKHEACMFAMYLLRNKPDKDQIALANRLLIFAEDQFVVWGQPPSSSAKFERLDRWFIPCSTEQYAMFEPISGSSAFMIMAWLRQHQATGEALPLEKAQALAASLIRAQQFHHGQYPTRMYQDVDRTWWLNSSINTIRAMRMLAKETEKKSVTMPTSDSEH